MLLLKALILLILLGIMPCFIGGLFVGIAPSGLKTRTGRLVLRYVSGIITSWAVFQLIAVPFILKDASFRRVVMLWIAALAALSAAGFVTAAFWKSRTARERRESFKKPEIQVKRISGKAERVWVLAAGVLIFALFLFQAGHHVLLTHIEDDDSRFIVTALEAYEHDQMYRVNPVTGVKMAEGEELSSDDIKDFCSPWMMYVAAVSKAAHLHPAIVAHLLLAVLLTALTYLVYWILGAALFPGSAGKTAGFTLLAGVLLQYFGGSTYTAGSFALTRIWQGKAVLAAAVIPLFFAEFFLLYQTGRNGMQRRNRLFALLTVTSLAACLLSGMGILFAAGLIAVFGLWDVAAYRNFRDFWKYGIALLPPAAYGLLHIMLG